MLAKELISDVVPALRTSDTGIKALNWMEIFRVSHLPIVNNEEFLGLISESDIYDYNMAEDAVGSHSLSLIRPFVLQNQHLYEVIEIVSRLKLTIIPVLNDKKQYLGVITIHDLVHYFSQLMAVQNPGGIIVLEMNIHDYSLTEIANIVESNDVKILSSYISTPVDSTKMEVTLKLNTTELAAVIHTFNRYEYNIKATFLEDETLKNMFEERFDEFLIYLNI